MGKVRRVASGDREASPYQREVGRMSMVPDGTPEPWIGGQTWDEDWLGLSRRGFVRKAARPQLWPIHTAIASFVMRQASTSIRLARSAIDRGKRRRAFIDK